MTGQSRSALTLGLTGASARLRALQFGAVGAVAAELVAALAAYAVAFDAPHLVRVTLAVALLFWAPGHCVAVLATISDPLLFAVVTVAASITVCLVVSLPLFYLQAWQGSVAVVIIAVVTVALAVVALLSRVPS